VTGQPHHPAPGVVPAVRRGLLGGAEAAMAWLNERLVGLSMVALLSAAGVLTSSVVTRYLFKVPTEWQDEASVFLMVGATFLCGPFVQSYRGHVGIEALAGVLPPGLERLRRLIADLISLLFTGFFAWKSWTLLAQAVVEHQTTSSSWAPPLWIPYAMMAVGMTLTALELVLQLAAGLARPEGGK
jgi:TRAP-type C4-dicarboxylate transport system permease small subunit